MGAAALGGAFVLTAACGGTAAADDPSIAGEGSAAVGDEDAAGRAFLDAHAQAARIRRGEISPVELVNETIEGIQRVNPHLNAMIILLFEKALREAETAPDGPFRGVPYFLKDLNLVSAGDLYTSGNVALKNANYRR